jgi:hypothetical protein
MLLNRRVLGVALAVGVIALIVLPEFGTAQLDLHAEWSESSTTMVSVANADIRQSPMPGYSQEKTLVPWKTLPLPTQRDVVIHYAQSIEYPWTRWIPLLKVGETKCQHLFFATRGKKTVVSGRRLASLSLTVVGLMAPDRFADFASKDALDEICKAVNERLAEIPAPPHPSAEEILAADPNVRRLSATTSFRLGRLKSASGESISEGEHQLRQILRQKDPIPFLTAAYNHGSPAAKAYALVGTHYLRPELFDRIPWDILAASDTRMFTYEHDSEGESTSLAKLCVRIKAGEFDSYLAALPEVKRSTN